MQRTGNDFKVPPCILVCRFGQKRKIEIAQIVINSAAARKPPDQTSAILTQCRQVTFRAGILVFSDNDCPFILPKIDSRFTVLHRIEQPLLHCQINAGIRAFRNHVIQALNHVCASSIFSFSSRSAPCMLSSKVGCG